MELKSFTLSAAIVIAGILLGESCQKASDGSLAASGLRVNTTYRCNAVEYDGPMRMFTSAGEVTDAAVIAGYRREHALVSDSSQLVAVHPENIYSTQSERVYYNGLVPYKAAVSNDVIVLRQQDTGTLGSGTPQGSIDYLFSSEQSFLALREQILDMQESFTKLERIDEQNYRLRESYHLKGAIREGAIRLPYTFMATRVKVGSYPFALKAGAMPEVPAGDTLLVREGHVTFH